MNTKTIKYTLEEYIGKYFNGYKAHFAKANKVRPPQVTQWINKEFIVINDELYSKRRKLSR